MRVFHEKFQTTRNWWKHETDGRVLFIVLGCLKNEAEVRHSSKIVQTVLVIRKPTFPWEYVSKKIKIRELQFSARNLDVVWQDRRKPPVVWITDPEHGWSFLSGFSWVSKLVHVTNLAPPHPTDLKAWSKLPQVNATFCNGSYDSDCTVWTVGGTVNHQKDTTYNKNDVFSRLWCEFLFCACNQTNGAQIYI